MDNPDLILAVDGGTTGSRLGLYSRDGQLLAEGTGGPANPSELGIDLCVAALSEAITRLGRGPFGTIAAGISGAARQPLRDEVARQLGLAQRAERVLVMSDLHPLMAANVGRSAAVLAIAGTGSSVIGQKADGRWVIVGGRGRVFGDNGSGYALAVAGLRAAADAIDGTGPETLLAEALQSEVGVNAFSELVPWSLRVKKPAIAALASVVDRVARQGDPVAVNCIKDEALHLADQVWTAALKIRAETETRVFVHGGLFDHSRLFRLYFDQALEGAEPKLTPMAPEVRGHACVLGIALMKEPLPDWVSVWTMAEQQKMGVPATEAAAEGSPLDALTPMEVVRRMNEHDHVAADAVAGAALQIAGVIEAAARAIGSGGRLIYVGAGTSGRLGVLDASECAPTFGLGQDRVMGLIAGGERALRESIEGAEDDISAGRMDIDGVRPPVGPRDVVIGVAASGRTPYTIAALREAKGNGARTAFVCCSPPLGAVADMLVQLQTGPEVLPGSTRLKAGTATKMVLNMISTGAMALSGYVYKGMMVGLRPVNAKLWDRAVRIVSILTGRGPGQAAKLLQDAEGRIQVAVIMAELGVEPAEAIRLLKLTRGNLREALGRR